MIKKIAQRVICLVLVATQSVWAAPMPALDMVALRETPSFFQIEMPEDLATVEEVYEAPASLDPRVILHIQNVHGNYQAQVQVKKMLNYFYKNYGFKIIFCEGAAEKMDSKYLEFFPDKKDNLALADDLAKKGQLTGPELYLMDAPEDVQAIGIEQTDLYRGNYEAFKQVYKSKKSMDSFTKKLDSRLELLSSRFLTRDMRRILSEWQKFHEGRREFMPFVKHLAEESQKFLNLDLNSLFAQVEWPQTARLLVLQSMEADLKQDEAMTERDALLTFLKEHKASETLITGLKKMEEKTISLQRLAMGKGEDPFQPRKLLERLAEEGAPMGFQFHQYPNFSLYAGYTILESELDSKVLFQEIEKLFDRILESLTVSEKEKNLLELYKDLELLKKLVALELTRTEWDQATYRKNWIQPQSLVERLDKMSASGFVTENLTVAKGIPAVFDAAFSFYDFARQREFAFYDTIEREMSAQKADRAILVTGGFHTDGLTDIFRSKQVNYGILTPRMGGDFDKANYVRTMMETHPTLFDLAQLEMIVSLSRSEVRFAMGGNVINHMETLLDTYLTHFNELAKVSLKLSDEEKLAAAFEAANAAIERLSGSGAGFIRLADETTKTTGLEGLKNQRFRFQLRLFNPETGMLETVKTKKGLPRLFLINPAFKESGRGNAVILGADKEGKDSTQYKAKKVSLPTATEIRKNTPTAVTTFLANNVRVTNGQRKDLGSGNYLSPEEFPDLGSAPAAVVADESRTIPARTGELDVDDLVSKGDIQAAIDSLASTIHDLASFQRFLDRQKKKLGAVSGITIEQVLTDMLTSGAINETEKNAIELLYPQDSNPGATAFMMKNAMNDVELQILANDIKEMLDSNKKQYLSLLSPEGFSEDQVQHMESLFHDVMESAQQRFKIMSPKGLNSSEVIRMMISLMQRVRDLGNGRITDLGKLHFTQGNEGLSRNVTVSNRPYGSISVDLGFEQGDSQFPVDAGPDFYPRLINLQLRIVAALSRRDLKSSTEATEISQELSDYLTSADEDGVYNLNKNAFALVAKIKAMFSELTKRREIQKSA